MSVPSSTAKTKRDESNGQEEVPAFKPKTSLGKKLWAIRKEIIASGAPLLTREEIEQEVAERRGEAT